MPPAGISARPVRLAATLIVLRDSAHGLQVLMMRRAEKANDQNSGAAVFPGGVLDPNDRALHARCSGLDDAAASQRLGLVAGGLDFYAAAVRECFEEAGLLYARGADGQPVSLEGFAADDLAALRRAAEQDTDALLALCDTHGWMLAVDPLVYFSHWLTPPGMPRRFDTRFFLAAMPPGQHAQADGRETVAHLWLRPEEALAPARGLKLMNVTRRILEQLQPFATAADCLAHARAQTTIPRVMPRVADGPEGRRPVNMEAPCYAELGHVDPDGLGGGRYALEPGLAMRLSPRVWRVTAGVPGEAGRPGANSYLVGGTRNEWALIDGDAGDSAHRELLRATAPGPVRWHLSTQADASAPQGAEPDAATQQLDLGEATLRILRSPGGTCGFLLEEEGMWFGAAPSGAVPDALPAVRWLAPRHGFLQPA